jgi:hypothetical protein
MVYTAFVRSGLTYTVLYRIAREVEAQSKRVEDAEVLFHSQLMQRSKSCVLNNFLLSIRIYCLLTGAFTGFSARPDQEEARKVQRFLRTVKNSGSLSARQVLSWPAEYCKTLTLFGEDLVALARAPWRASLKSAMISPRVQLASVKVLLQETGLIEDESLHLLARISDTWHSQYELNRQVLCTVAHTCASSPFSPGAFEFIHAIIEGGYTAFLRPLFPVSASFRAFEYALLYRLYYVLLNVFLPPYDEMVSVVCKSAKEDSSSGSCLSEGLTASEITEAVLTLFGYGDHSKPEILCTPTAHADEVLPETDDEGEISAVPSVQSIRAKREAPCAVSPGNTKRRCLV